MPKALMLAFTQPVSSSVEDEYNRWYSEQHLPDLTRVAGLISATRYKLDKNVQAMPGVNSDPRSYLALYEIEADTSEDLAKFAKSLTQAIEAGKVDVSPTMDMINISASFLLPISERMLAEGKS